jgi:hypothetical protein
MTTSLNEPTQGHDPIVQILERFQSGYTTRDVTAVAPFVEDLFAEDSTVIGTGADEWCVGIDAIRKLVESDWSEWGDLRIEIDKAVVAVVRDTAWTAVPGTVSLEQVFPIRVAGGLIREQGKWKFKQMIFSYPHPRKPVSDK